MKYLIFLSCFFLSILSSGQKPASDFCLQGKKESLSSIHPGIPDKQPFWNEYSKMFKFAPSFNFIKFKALNKYTYTAFSFADKQYYTFTADNPNASLAPIWNRLPAGEVYLKVEAQTGIGKETALSGTRTFYRAASFCPPYPDAKYPVKDALLKGLKYLYSRNYIKSWYSNPAPDHKSHELFCYSAKIVGSLINSMLLYSKYFPKNDSAIVIAKNAADYLIAHSEPKGAPLEYFPQTYEGTAITAGRFGKEIILMEPPQTGLSYLNLYDKTKDKKYFDAAVDIANTFAKTQLPSGTWYIRILKETGKPASDVLCIPMGIINFLSVLVNDYKQQKFQKVIDPAMKWIWDNPVKTYDWTGQFEDIAAAEPYHNLTKYEASWFAQYLLDNKDKDTSYVRIAKELVAFCEDQFVLWEKPAIYDSRGTSSENWTAPSALEQYHCYLPIDASCQQLAYTFMKVFEKTDEQIYHQKSVALINSLINVQKDDGLIPTFWKPDKTGIWINCIMWDLMFLDKVVSGS
jgi:maltose/maltodextrin transport system substrate-binding protein